MKVLIPASGGVNSAYALWRWLAETTDEVVALHFAESFEGADDESAEFAAVADWLAANVRPFARDYLPLPDISLMQDMRPTRVGFKEKVGYGFAVARYNAYAEKAVEHGCDAVVLGISLENTATDRHPILIPVVEAVAAVYLPAYSMTQPVAPGTSYDEMAKVMSGRFEQYEALPAALRDVVKCCDPAACEDVFCLRCAYERGYQKFLTDGKTGKDFDLWCAEKGTYGPWRHIADVEKYRWRGGCCDDCAPVNYLADLVGREWPIVLHRRAELQPFADIGKDVTGVAESEERYADFMDMMKRKLLDSGVDPDGMTLDEYHAALLAVALEAAG